MVTLYKNWVLDADESRYYVGQVVEGKMENPVAFDTAAEAVKHVIESEIRKGVEKPELLRCTQFIAMCSGIADDVLEAVNQAPCGMARNVVMKYKPVGMETR